MFGLFQIVFYFSYMALGSIALGILCGECIELLWVLVGWDVIVLLHRHRGFCWNRILYQEDLFHCED